MKALRGYPVIGEVKGDVVGQLTAHTQNYALRLLHVVDVHHSLTTQKNVK